jgi:hypothetical protein
VNILRARRLAAAFRQAIRPRFRGAALSRVDRNGYSFARYQRGEPGGGICGEPPSSVGPNNTKNSYI